MPRKYQQTALLVGIILALFFRGIFIAVGAAAINEFSWVFYLFGAFLVYTAIHLAKQGENDDEDYKENAVIRFAKKRLNATDEYNGVKLTVMQNGKRLVTPMAIVIIALGTTDLLFALDSIPAIYGLTQEPFLVFTANVFALMGLRQLYFLLGDLLRRLVYLSLGLSVVLAFIGVKLVLHAMHENELPFINGGKHIDWAPEIPIWVSLGFIIVTLGITTVLSLRKSRTMQDAAPEVEAAQAASEPEQTDHQASPDQPQHRSPNAPRIPGAVGVSEAFQKRAAATRVCAAVGERGSFSSRLPVSEACSMPSGRRSRRGGPACPGGRRSTGRRAGLRRSGCSQRVRLVVGVPGDRAGRAPG